MMLQEEKKRSPGEESATSIVKRIYVPPTLSEYGSVAKLTQGGNGSGTDGGTDPTMMKQCL
jgi:hypothetical protein